MYDPTYSLQRSLSVSILPLVFESLYVLIRPFKMLNRFPRVVLIVPALPFRSVFDAIALLRVYPLVAYLLHDVLVCCGLK